jgi:glycerol kinase
LRDELGLIQSAEETEVLALSVPSSEGVTFIPALSGLGAPHWKPNARGKIIGLSRGTTKAHIVRATLESLAFQTKDIVEDIKAHWPEFILNELRVDGGASKNNFLMQFQADVLGVPVNRPKLIETTALGAAMIAGLGAEILTLENLDSFREIDTVFEVQSELDLSENYDVWKNAIETLL